MHAVAASLHTLIDSTVLSDVHDGVYLAITPGCDILCLREQCNIPPFLQTSTESCLWGFLSSEKVLHNWIYCQVLLQKWILAKRISLHQVCIWSHRKCCMEICTPQMPAWLVKLYLESLNQIFFFFFFFFFLLYLCSNMPCTQQSTEWSCGCDWKNTWLKGDLHLQSRIRSSWKFHGQMPIKWEMVKQSSSLQTYVLYFAKVMHYLLAACKFFSNFVPKAGSP